MTWGAFWFVFALVWAANVALAVARPEKAGETGAKEAPVSEACLNEQHAEPMTLGAHAQGNGAEHMRSAVLDQSAALQRRSEHLVEHWPLTVQLPLFRQLPE